MFIITKNIYNNYKKNVLVLRRPQETQDKGRKMMKYLIFYLSVVSLIIRAKFLLVKSLIINKYYTALLYFVQNPVFQINS